MEAPANRVVYEHLAKQAYDALDRREERLGAISTPAQFKEYQENLKKFFVSRIGGFPERTPLHAKVVGKIEVGDHRIEKVIYESCLLYTSPSPRDRQKSRMPSSA